MSAAARKRIGVAASPRTAIPTRKAPTEPIPVQTAYALPSGNVFMDMASRMTLASIVTAVTSLLGTALQGIAGVSLGSNPAVVTVTGTVNLAPVRALLVQDITDGSNALISRVVQAEDVAQRRPVTWLNYPGDVTGGVVELIDHRVPMGPDTIGEWLWPVSASYDVATDRTRVGFSYLPPATHRSAA